MCPLRQREVEVLSLLAEGYSAARIAKSLVVTEATVRAHLHKVYTKLNAANGVQAVAVGIRQGWI